MSEYSFPYTAWVLTPSFIPKQVELVEAAYYNDWHSTKNRKSYHISDLFIEKKNAIEAGWRRLDEQESALRKRADAINKKKANLTKHSQVQA